jgi:hypothetical protein
MRKETRPMRKEPSPVNGTSPGAPSYKDPAVFRDEIAGAVRYERGLLVKLAVALLIVGLVVVARVVFFS